MITRRGSCATAVVGVAALIAACTGGDGGTTFTDMLELVPSTAVEPDEHGVTVMMADLERAAELAGLE